MKKLAMLLVFTALVSIQAADHAGTGGFTVRCTTTDGSTLTLLDYFPDLPISLGGPDLAPIEKVNLALSRLERLDPERARRYEAKAAEFLSGIHWSSKLLINLNDVGPVDLPPNCFLVPSAIQRQPISSNDKPYTFDQNIWNELDDNGQTDEQAGLILHEIIYNETGILLGQPDSEEARAYNALIASEKIETMDPATYAEIASKVFIQPISFLDPGNFNYSLKAGSNLTISLPALLKYPGKGNLTWTFRGPPWLTLDSKSQTLLALPPLGVSGGFEVSLEVGDDSNFALANLALDIKVPIYFSAEKVAGE